MGKNCVYYYCSYHRICSTTTISNNGSNIVASCDVTVAAALKKARW